jgi:hypothetical protein
MKARKQAALVVLAGEPTGTSTRSGRDGELTSIRFTIGLKAITFATLTEVTAPAPSIQKKVMGPRPTKTATPIEQQKINEQTSVIRGLVKLVGGK